MNESDSSKSGAGKGVIIVVAALLLYVGSYGPAWGLVYHARISASAQGFCSKFYAPLLWVRMNTPLARPLNAYVDWWVLALAERELPQPR